MNPINTNQARNYDYKAPVVPENSLSNIEEVKKSFQFDCASPLNFSNLKMYGEFQNLIDKVRGAVHQESFLCKTEVELALQRVYLSYSDISVCMEHYCALYYLIQLGKVNLATPNFREQLGNLLFKDGSELRSSHKSLYNSYSKEFTSNHEAYVIRHLASMLFVDGEYHSPSVALVMYMLNSTRIRELFKDEHIKQMVESLASIKGNDKFTRLMNCPVVVDSSCQDYIRHSLMLSDDLMVNSFYFYLDFFIFLFQPVVQRDEKTCYAIATLRFLKKRYPINLAHRLIEAYCSGKFLLGCSYVSVSEIAGMYLKDSDNYEQIYYYHAGPQALISLFQKRFPYQKIQGWALSMDDLIDNRPIRKMHAAQLRNPMQTIILSIFKVLGPSGSCIRPTGLKFNFVDFLIKLFASGQEDITVEEEAYLREQLNQKLWFQDLPTAQVRQITEEMLELSRAGEVKTLLYESKYHRQLASFLPYETGCYFLDEFRWEQVDAIGTLRSKITNLLPKRMERLVSYLNSLDFGQKISGFIATEAQQENINLKDLPTTSTLFFCQSGGVAEHLLQWCCGDAKKTSINCASASEFIDQISSSYAFADAGLLVVGAHLATLCAPRIDCIDLGAKKQSIVELRERRWEDPCPQSSLEVILRECFGATNAADHQRTLLFHAQTAPSFRIVREYCFYYLGRQQSVIDAVHRCVEMVDLTVDNQKIAVKMLFPKLPSYKLGSIVEGNLGGSVKQVACKLRKKLIAQGLVGVDLERIEQELYIAAGHPPKIWVANTNWVRQHNPVIWQIGVHWGWDTLMMFEISKRTSVCSAISWDSVTLFK